ncbi:hypothetical protein SAMN04487996_1431 [Dyadobacter soli]|uniref:Uncharacterized protein n=2 Tax=Dyadobacter soli TaxID=659014 RepID=A0A1G8D3K8_9BACT|nr:hypothetical protein SAMN04487996_1431 [Dyadobacter soli]
MAFTCLAQKKADKLVKFQIVNQDSTETNYSFKWPFESGPKPVGGTKALIEKVDKILAEHGVPCPPKRKKLTDAVWLCGNGKMIKTSDSKLIDLFSEAWDDEE